MSKEQEWSNWAGDVTFRPDRVERPRDEEELAGVVRRAAEEGKTVRVAGSCHSSNPLMASDEVLVSMEKVVGIEDPDTENHRATIRAGMRLREAGEELAGHGLMMENIGDIDLQAIAGAVGTGTHGSGKRFTNLSGMVVGGRIVTGTGEILEFSEDQNPEILRAGRVALGSLGIFSALRLRMLPSYKLVRQEWCTHIEDCLEQLDRLAEDHRSFDFYWYPRSDEAKIRTWNPPGEEPESIPGAKLVKRQEGYGKDVMGTEQYVRYHEAEYAIPAEAGADCLREIRERVKRKHRQRVAWRILCRQVAADDGYLSNCHDRTILAITLHHNSTLPCWDYFKDIEPIYRAFDGRPHWGKKHTMKAEQLRPLYPRWDDFQAIRRRLDPGGIFLSPYVRGLLLEEGER